MSEQINRRDVSIALALLETEDDPKNIEKVIEVILFSKLKDSVSCANEILTRRGLVDFIIDGGEGLVAKGPIDFNWDAAIDGDSTELEVLDFYNEYPSVFKVSIEKYASSNKFKVASMFLSSGALSRVCHTSSTHRVVSGFVNNYALESIKDISSEAIYISLQRAIATRSGVYLAKGLLARYFDYDRTIALIDSVKYDQYIAAIILDIVCSMISMENMAQVSKVMDHLIPRLEERKIGHLVLGYLDKDSVIFSKWKKISIENASSIYMEEIDSRLRGLIEESVDVSDMVEYSEKFAIPLLFCLEKRPDLIDHREFLDKYLDGVGKGKVGFKSVVTTAMNSKSDIAIHVIVNKLCSDRDTRKLKMLIGIMKQGGGFDEGFLEKIIDLREGIISDGNSTSYSREEVMRQLFSKVRGIKEKGRDL